MVVAGGGTEDVDRWLGQVLGPLGARHHECPGTVGDQAAVEEVQGLDCMGDDSTSSMVIGFSVTGPGVHGRPLARSTPRSGPAARGSCRTAAMCRVAARA